MKKGNEKEEKKGRQSLQKAFCKEVGSAVASGVRQRGCRERRAGTSFGSMSFTAEAAGGAEAGK